MFFRSIQIFKHFFFKKNAANLSIDRCPPYIIGLNFFLLFEKKLEKKFDIIKIVCIFSVQK